MAEKHIAGEIHDVAPKRARFAEETPESLGTGNSKPGQPGAAPRRRLNIATITADVRLEYSILNCLVKNSKRS